MEKDTSSMDVSVGEKVVPEPTVDTNDEVTSQPKEVDGESSEVVDDNDDAVEQKGEVAKKKKKKNKSKKKKEAPKQTDPPSIPVFQLFPSGEFPEGEIQQYKNEWDRGSRIPCVESLHLEFASYSPFSSV